MDSANRDRKREWKDAQRNAARKAFPLAGESLEQLFSAVDSAVEQNGCDHTLRFTEMWLTKHVNDRQTTLAWLKEHGGYCDCEVVMNSCGHWEQNR